MNWVYRDWIKFFDAPPPAARVGARVDPLERRPYLADAVFGDFDNDGWLDLVVLDRHESPNLETRALLFMNRGDGTFEPKLTSSLNRSPIHTTFVHEPRRFQMRQRAFEFGQFASRPVNFQSREVNDLQELFKHGANVLDVGQETIRADIRFTTMNLIAVDREIVVEVQLLRCGFGHERRKHGPGFGDLARLGFEVGMDADDVG